MKDSPMHNLPPIMPPPVIHMTKEELFNWRMAERLSKRKAALLLGVARNTFASYEAGRHMIPRYIMLACQAISAEKIAA
jgi:DNA-binding XRE family transcriptional regulator